jgi:hypothetical protein
MKKLLLTLLVAITFLGVVVNATETNTLNTADSGKSEAGSYEFTLGGSGSFVNEESSSYGLDFSISTNPLEAAPNVWFGLIQGLYWEPRISGSTDVNINYSFNLFGDLYVNAGWSVGAVYARADGDFDHYWRTGPEATLQYYVAENAFIYAGVNYDIVSEGENGFRPSIGIGLSF